MKEVHVFTDGACLGNPGPGGYGVILKYKNVEKELSRGFKHTTNNRMELLAIIAALEALTEPCVVHVTTDSKYVKDGLSSWIVSWKRKGWTTADGKGVKNVDLWKKLDNLCSKHQVHLYWVKGHAGHSENERCDKLARQAAQNDPDKLESDDSQV